MWCANLRQGKVNIANYNDLHPEGKRLIGSWFDRAWQSYEDNDDAFEAFIFLWISFNGWATCVTALYRDTEVINAIAGDQDIATEFNSLLRLDDGFAANVSELCDMLPIFDPRRLPFRHWELFSPDKERRRQRVQSYLNTGTTSFSPPCWKEHTNNGGHMPEDWPHVLKAIYQIRCNLFHGQKTAFQQLDRDLVDLAFKILHRFVAQGHYLK